MTDRELLELAAKAAGVTIKYNYIGTQDARCPWNPLDDDGDALRLAVKLNIRFAGEWRGTAMALTGMQEFIEQTESDPCAATRRAIVRAAAEIGKGLK